MDPKFRFARTLTPTLGQNARVGMYTARNTWPAAFTGVTSPPLAIDRLGDHPYLSKIESAHYENLAIGPVPS